MENRVIFVAFSAVILGILINVASAQSFDSPVPCTSTAACNDSRLPEEARCQAGFCVCPDQDGAPKNCSTYDMQPKSAGRNPAAIQTCKLPQDCNLPNEFCNQTRSQCACAEGFIMASETRKCLIVARNLGAVCEEDQQCQKNMMNTSCIERQCVCKPGYHAGKNNTCWKTADLGGYCSHDEECAHTDSAECDKNSSTCVCSNATIPTSDGKKCLVFATQMLEACVEKSQCTKMFGNSDCIDKRCQCLKNNHYERSASACVQSRNLGEHCYKSHECFQDEEEGMPQPQSCVNSICVCNENFVSDGNKCIHSGSSSIVPGIFLCLLSGIFLFSRS